MNISKISFAGHIGTANFKGQPKTIKENSSETLQTGFELPNATQYDYSPLFTDPSSAFICSKNAFSISCEIILISSIIPLIIIPNQKMKD